jgi:hypothetical protein
MIKKLSLTIVLGIFCGTVFQAQINQIPYKEGQKITLEVVDYGKDITNNSKFISIQKGERSKAAIAHNDKVISGKAKGKSKKVIYTVSNVIQEEGLQKADLQTEVNGVNYTSEVAIFNDTLFFTRLTEPVIGKDAEGNITSVYMMGVEQLPANMKAGTTLVPYHDYGVSTPKFSSYNAQRKEHVGTTYGLPYLDYLGRTCRTVTHRYKTISAEVRKEETPYMHAIHNVEGEVVKIEEIEFNGNKYNAYLIESMTWSKFGADIKLESADAKIQKQQIKNHERGEKLMNRAMGTNSDGYLQMLVQKWYVPELGVVKQMNYDHNGAISTTTQLLSIQ